jgi:hypothetical protein
MDTLEKEIHVIPTPNCNESASEDLESNSDSEEDDKK